MAMIDCLTVYHTLVEDSPMTSFLTVNFATKFNREQSEGVE